MSKRTIAGLTILLVTVFCLATACSPGASESEGETATTTPTAESSREDLAISAENLSIVEHSMGTNADGAAVISVKAQNVGDATMQFAEIKVLLLDKDGNLIKPKIERVYGLDPDETWEFEVVIPDNLTEEVKNYEIEIGNLY